MTKEIQKEKIANDFEIVNQIPAEKFTFEVNESLFETPTINFSVSGCPLGWLSANKKTHSDTVQECVVEMTEKIVADGAGVQDFFSEIVNILSEETEKPARDQLENSEKEIQKLRADINRKSKELADYQSKIEELQSKIENLNNFIFSHLSIENCDLGKSDSENQPELKFSWKPENHQE